MKSTETLSCDVNEAELNSTKDVLIECHILIISTNILFYVISREIYNWDKAQTINKNVIYFYQKKFSLIFLRSQNFSNENEHIYIKLL